MLDPVGAGRVGGAGGVGRVGGVGRGTSTTVAVAVVSEVLTGVVSVLGVVQAERRVKSATERRAIRIERKNKEIMDMCFGVYRNESEMQKVFDIFFTLHTQVDEYVMVAEV